MTESSIRTRTTRAPEEARSTAVAVARAVSDAKGDDVVVIDVRGLSQITDYLVVASGTSDRQMRSAADDAVEVAKARGEAVFGVTTDTGTHWIVVDLVDVVLHLFEPVARAHYDMESLWGDGKRVPWRREEGTAGEPSTEDAG